MLCCQQREGKFCWLFQHCCTKTATFITTFSFFWKRESGSKNIPSSILYSQICEFISLLWLSLFTEKSVLAQGYADLNGYYVFFHSTVVKRQFTSHISNNNLSETGSVYHHFPSTLLFHEPQIKKNKKSFNKISIYCEIGLRQDRISSCSPPFLDKAFARRDEGQVQWSPKADDRQLKVLLMLWVTLGWRSNLL